MEAFLKQAQRANGKKLSAQTVHHLRAIRRAALSDAVKKGLIARNVEAAAKMDAILAGADPALVKHTEARIN